MRPQPPYPTHLLRALLLLPPPLVYAVDVPCGSSLRSCLMHVDDGGDFGVEYVREPWRWDPDVMCKKEAWLGKDECYETCPLSVRVDSEALGVAASFCILHSLSEPWVDGHHILPGHRLYDTALPLVVFPSEACLANPDGVDWEVVCRAADKALLLERYTGSPACKFIQCRRRFAWFQPAAVIFGDNRGVWDPFDLITVAITGHYNTSFPFMSAEPLLLDILEHGQAAQAARAPGNFTELLRAPPLGRIRTTCRDPASTPAPPEFWDGCPHSGLIGRCGGAARPQDRLCAACPLRMRVAPSAAGQFFCMWGNALLPRRRRHYIQGTPGGLPFAGTLVLVNFEDAATGCSLADFAGVPRGAVVAISDRLACRFRAVRLAEAAGAAAVVLLTSRKHETNHKMDSPPETVHMLRGPGGSVGIPVHALHIDASEQLCEILYREGAASYHNGTGQSATHYTVSVTIDTPPEAAEPVVSEPPTGAVEAHGAEAGVPAPASAAIDPTLATLAVLTVAASVCFCAYKIRQAFAVAEQRHLLGEVDLPQGAQVPLAAASTALSLSVLLVVGVLSVSLSVHAGRTAATAAIHDGRDAADATYSHCVELVEARSQDIRRQALTQVGAALGAILVEAERAVATTAVLYRDASVDYDTLDAQYSSFVDAAYLALGRKGLEEPKWILSLKSTAAAEYYTDPWVKLTRTGDLVFQRRTAETGVMTPSMTLFFDAAHTVSPYNRIGGQEGDVIAALADHGATFRWFVGREGRPYSATQQFRYPDLSLTVAAPVFSRHGARIGAMTAQTGLERIGATVRDAIDTGGSGGTSNMSVTVFEGATYHLIGGTEHVSKATFARVVDEYWGVATYVPHYETLTLETSCFVADNALYHYVRSRSVGDECPVAMTGTFDQHEYYDHLKDHRFLDVSVGGDGAVADHSPAPFRLQHQTCGADGRCHTAPPATAVDPVYGAVLAFTGRNTLYIDTNLTDRAPQVLAAQGQPSVYDARGPIPGTNRTCVRWGAFDPHPWNGRFPRPFCSKRESPFYSDYSMHIRVKPDEDVRRGDRSQVLFAQGLGGYSALTVYANGDAVLTPLLGGCTAHGVETLPKGVWSSIWVQVQYTPEKKSGYCMVYVNATEAAPPTSRSGIHDDYFPEGVGGEMWGVGAGFKGAVQAVQIFPFFVSAAERAAVQRTGRFVRDVPRRRWLLDLTTFTHTGGVEWRMAVRIPREDIMRAADSQKERVLRDLRVREANTHAKLDKATAELILIVIMVGCLSVGAFLIFNERVMRPFTQVSSVMFDAAIMHVDDISPDASFITEINAIHLATKIMLKNLREYKSYMPHFITGPGSSCEDDDTDDGATDVAALSDSQRCQPARPADPLNSVEALPCEDQTELASFGASEVSGETMSSSVFNASPAIPPALNPLRPPPPSVLNSTGEMSVESGAEPRDFSFAPMESSSMPPAQQGNWLQKTPSALFSPALSLEVKKVTLLALNVVGFHAALAVMETEALAAHAGILQRALTAAAKAKGFVDSFSGDRFLLSFNASKQCSSHRSHACRVGLAFRDAAAEHEMRTSGAAVSREIRVGILGTDSMKKMSFISPALGFSYALERYAKHLGYALITDSYVADECRLPPGNFVHRRLGFVHYPKLSPAPERVHEVVFRGQPQQAQEWMYALDQQQRHHPFAAWDEFVKAVCLGEWETAAALSEQHPLFNAPEGEPIARRMRAAMTQRHYKPETLERY